MNKKITITIIAAVFGLLLTATNALASTFNFSPANVLVNAGQTFAVNVSLDPQGSKNYTIKMVVNFPADLLQVNSFTLANNWVAITSSGYDQIDNANGMLIKSAGYPGGTLSSVPFGAISFTAKKQGSGSIALANSSLILGNTGQNLLSGAPAQSSINISVVLPVSTITPPTTQAPTAPASGANPATVNPPTVTPPTPETTTTNLQPEQTEAVTPVIPISPGPASLLTAARRVRSLLSLGTDKNWLAFVITVIILSTLWYLGRKYFSKKKSANPIK